MQEINKLRQRLKNVKKNVTEYRMTVAEANRLISEIDALEQKLQEKSLPATVNEPVIATRTIDGGSFI